jgi:hypothetical protein
LSSDGLVVKPRIHGCFAISMICALSAPSVNSLILRSESFGMFASSVRAPAACCRRAALHAP